MRNSNILLLVLVVIGFICYFYYSSRSHSSQSQELPPVDLKAEIFSDCNFSETLGYLSPGDYDTDVLLNRNSVNEISSVRVPKGLKVDLFTDSNFKGEKLTLTEDYPCFEQNFNDSVKSIRVSYL